MKQVGFIVLVGIVLVLQLSFLPALRPLGVVPDATLVLVVLVGLASTVSRALAVALVGGLLLDLASGADFGLRLGLFVLAALTTGLVRRAGFHVTSLLVPLVLVAAGTVLADLIVLAGLASTVSSWPVGQLAGIIGLELVVNLLVMLVLRPLVNWLTPADTTLAG